MQDPIYTEITSKERPTVFAACALILLAAAGLWLSSLLELALPGASAAVMNLAYYLPFLALPAALYVRRRPGLFDALRPGPLSPGAALIVALLALVSVYAASAVSMPWGWMLDRLGLRSVGSTPTPSDSSEMALAILSMAALPAACEELLFRGIVLSAWESRGTRRAILVTAGLFALLHGNLYGLPVYLLVGAIAGYITWALDSLYAGIVYHTVYNAACLVLPWLLYRDGATQAAAEAAEASAGAFVLALQLGFEVMLIFSMLAALMYLVRLRAERAGLTPIPRIPRPLSRPEKTMLGAALAEMTVSLAVLTAIASLAGGGA